MITRLDIVGNLIEALRRDELTKEQLLAYCEAHAHILKSNVEQALLRYNLETVGEVLQANLAQYAADKARILANYASFSQVAGRATEQVIRTYGHDIPDVVLVPCMGLYSNGGWAQRVDDKTYICVALERLSQGGPLDILLVHEIAHGIAETNWDTVLDGFYGEGHATYVSSVLCPGHPEDTYFVMGKEDWLSGYLDWIEENRERILQDAAKPLQVLNPVHKFYFTTSYNPAYPNIGYLIGYLYLKHLHIKYMLPQLRTLGKDEHLIQREFVSFISTWTRG